MTTALIDGDIVCYRAAAASENDPLDIAIIRCDKTMRDILDQTQADRFMVFIGGGENFRHTINPDYKANRKDTPKPKHLEDCRERLLTEWGCEMAVGLETDDLLGINQEEDTFIASIDKDLLQIPGNHFNWVKQESQTVSELDGVRWFWKQMLIGDVSDNLVGVKGIGKVKASKYIDHLETQQEMFDVVYGLYKNEEKRFLVNGLCFYIMQRGENDIWLDHLKQLTLPNQLEQEVEVLYESMKSLMGVM